MAEFDYEAECPHCGASFGVPRIRLGREETCPVCRGVVVVGAGDAAELEGHRQAPPRGRAAAGPAETPALRGIPRADESGPALVCCAREQKLNPIRIGRLLSHFTDAVAMEARQRVAKSKGLLAEGLSLDAARHLVEALAEEGVEAFACPAAWVPEMEQALPLVRVYDANERALGVQTDDQGTVKTVPWRRVAAGACIWGALPRTVRTETPVDDFYAAGIGLGMRLAHRGGYSVRRRQEEPEARIVLALKGKARKAYLLAFTERQVRYGYLEERMRPSRVQNLEVFLGDVLAHAREAFFPRGFRAAAEGDRVHRTKAVGRVDYDNYVRWVLCCAAARGLFRSP
ncbi:MAG: hypothetical protein ACYS8K_02070 [Planctomycetota bacterium]|jgi:hypothetical protein